MQIVSTSRKSFSTKFWRVLIVLAWVLCCTLPASTVRGETPWDYEWLPKIVVNDMMSQMRVNMNLLDLLCKGYRDPAYGNCTTFKLLRVTAVMTADDDGTKAMYRLYRFPGTNLEWVVPKEPQLRDHNLHQNLLTDNFIADWIRLANQQLLASGACFGLDVENIRYERLDDTKLNTQKCEGSTQADGLYASTLLQNAGYGDSVILLFTNAASETGQGCSGLCTPTVGIEDCHGQINHQEGVVGVIRLPRYRTRPIPIDGTVAPGNNHLTHELGHYLGLVDIWPGSLAQQLSDLSGYTGGWNSNGLPWTSQNAPLLGKTWVELVNLRESALEVIANYGPHLVDGVPPGDTDATAGPVRNPDYVIYDTPVDMGPGLAYIMGDLACEGEQTYTLNRYDYTSNPRKVYTETVTINDTVRDNAMNYWWCGPPRQHFSVDQVRRMTYVLETERPQVVGRVIEFTVSPQDLLCRPWIRFPDKGRWMTEPALPPSWLPPISQFDPGRYIQFLRDRMLAGESILPQVISPDTFNDCLGGCGTSDIFPLPPGEWDY